MVGWRKKKPAEKGGLCPSEEKKVPRHREGNITGSVVEHTEVA